MPACQLCLRWHALKQACSRHTHARPSPSYTRTSPRARTPSRAGVRVCTCTHMHGECLYVHVLEHAPPTDHAEVTTGAHAHVRAPACTHAGTPHPTTQRAAPSHVIHNQRSTHTPSRQVPEHPHMHSCTHALLQVSTRPTRHPATLYTFTKAHVCTPSPCAFSAT